MSRPGGDRPVIEKVTCGVFTFPTPYPEADGTVQWDSTTAVTVQLESSGCVGLGWTYSSSAARTVIEDKLSSVLQGRPADELPGGYEDMRRACRNLGTPGLVMQAISAVDIAWWDLHARLLEISVTRLLGRCRSAISVYGSGGFTTMDEDELKEQVDGWQQAGCRAMKIKIGESWGSAVDRDLARVRQLRNFAGDGVDLMVDANGGYSLGQAHRVGAQLDELGVIWFEEPVSSDDVDGLRVLRQALRLDVAAGEYVADVFGAERLATVVDCLQLDATRCGGYTGFLRGAAVAAAHNREVSGHCAPSLHAAVTLAVPNARNIEWFADHARLEPILVDGAPEVSDGRIGITDDVVGHGMTLSPEADRFREG
jgi:L-alanine-DL-glutamate epimerase-like enolase superfamily enzyme